MRINTIQLFSVPSDYGHGANDGAYYPVGLLTIGTYLKRKFPSIEISIIDRHHDYKTIPNASIVGISASSTLNYKNVLKCATEAKRNGSIVVFGGPHATLLADQIMKNQIGLVDFIIRGNGEIPFENLINAFINGNNFKEIENLSWRNHNNKVIHNKRSNLLWKYDDYLPLDFSLLNINLKSYWDTFKNKIDNTIDAAFVVFTHFGCGYREMIIRANQKRNSASWCSYCSLNDPLFSRDAAKIVNETIDLIKQYQIPKGSKILLKCYGDNVGTQIDLLEDLKDQISKSSIWHDYNIIWTFYSQSSRITIKTLELLTSIGVENLYIGFDSVDDEIQRLNGLGTSRKNHYKAATLCKKYGVKIQAGFVLGCIGETTKSINESIEFAEELASNGLLERINAAVLFIIPGSPAYDKLCEREPWIKELDVLDTEELQYYWVKHFCPELAQDSKIGIDLLKNSADYLDELSPGPHASMGYISKKLLIESIE